MVGRVLIGEKELDQFDLSESERNKFLKVVVSIKEKRKRTPSIPPPEGGIAIREASRKYGIPSQTISGWVAKGYIPILLRTKNWLYIDESKLIEVIKKFRKNPGRGKWTVR